MTTNTILKTIADILHAHPELAVFLTLAVGFALVLAGQAFAIPLTVGSAPQLFEFTGGIGWIDNPADGYQLTLTGSTRIDITDRLMIGDQYRLFVNGVAMMTTSTPSNYLNGAQTGTNTFDEAWATRSEGELDSIATHFIGRAELLRNKEHTGRAKDLGDAQELRKRITDRD